MRWFRDLIYLLLLIISSPIWLLALLRTGKWRTDWVGRLGLTSVHADPRATLLIHAVSVGEVNATRLMVDLLQSRHGDQLRIIIATTTNTGTARARQLYAERCAVVRFPLDFSLSVQCFLDRIRPDAIVLMELELWPNLMDLCRRRRIPVAVVNGRLSERSFKRYHMFRPLVSGMFRALSRAGVQDGIYARRFEQLGTPSEAIQVTGTMKWDNARIVDQIDGARALGACMGIDPDRPLIVCGSTGPGEEAMLRRVLEPICGPSPSGPVPVQVLMAPRKPERFDEAAEVLPGCCRRSDCDPATARPIDPQQRWFLLDTIGDLPKAYALADLVIVGRSFCPLYGSDMMEPIALGRPVLIGPNTSDFQDMMDKLLAGGGIEQLSSVQQVPQAVTRLLGADAGRRLAEAGRKVIAAQQGATRRHVVMIERLLGLPVAEKEPSGERE